jgi:hypothetical protein
MPSKKSDKYNSPPPYATARNSYPVQEHAPLLHQQSYHATSPTQLHIHSTMQNQQQALLSPSAPNFQLQYLEPFIAAPSVKIISAQNTGQFSVAVYGHAHSAATLQMTASNKLNKRIKAAKIATLGWSNKTSLTLTSAAGNALIKIQRDVFGKRFLVKSPHNKDTPIGSIEPNFMKTEYKLFVDGQDIEKVTMNVSGLRIFCMDKKFDFFIGGTDSKIGSLGNDGMLVFNRDFPEDANVRILAVCAVLMFKLFD